MCDSRRTVKRLFVQLALCAAALRPEHAAATTASVAPEGYIVIDGEPFFPIGMYHVSWIGDRQGRKAVPDVRAMADAGMNTVHPTVDARPDMVELFDEAQARSMFVFGEIPWPEQGPGGFINLWKNHSAMIGWLLRDDFNAPYSGPPSHPPASVLARHDDAKALAPDQLTIASGGSYPGFRIAEYARTMDVMGMQSYPVSALNSPFEDELEENAASFDWVRDELAGTGQVFVASPQAFRWPGGGRWPTTNEARNMLYPPLLRGAKGVLWYTYWDGHGVLPETNPALWQELRAEVAELKSLTPFFLHATRTEQSTGHARLRASRFDHDGQSVFILVNTDRTDTYAVTLPVPTGATPIAHRMLPARDESGLSVSGGNLVGDVGPEEVHVVLVDTTVAGNASPIAAATHAPALVAYGEQVTLDASTSSDSDGVIAAEQWDFGDGAFASGLEATHAYERPGTYHVRLTVRDDDGAPATAFEQVDVALTSLCPPAPIAGCESAGSATLSMKRAGNDPRRSVRWKWRRGAVDPADLGDPRSSTEVALCVYANGMLVRATAARPDASLWRLGGNGFKLSGGASRPGGVSKASLRPGTPTSGSLSLSADGVELPPMALPLSLPVRAQLVTGGTGACFDTTFDVADMRKNTIDEFRAASH